MTNLANVIGELKKLNDHNYVLCHSYIKLYLQGQDLWEVAGGIDTAPPSSENAKAMHKQRIKVRKALFVLKATVQKEFLEHIQETDTPKSVWNTLEKHFVKTNNARLHLGKWDGDSYSKDNDDQLILHEGTNSLQ